MKEKLTLSVTFGVNVILKEQVVFRIGDLNCKSQVSRFEYGIELQIRFLRLIVAYPDD